MKPILAFTLAGLVAMHLSQPLPAQPALDATLTQVASAGGGPSVPASRLVTSLTPPDRERAASIPLDQIGATEEQQYSGDGLSVCASEGGARLRCVFQKIEGEVTREGLWLTSTVTNTMNGRFRVVATSVGRCANTGDDDSPAAARELPPGFGVCQSSGAAGVQDAVALPPTGSVAVAGKLVRFIRPGLIEEYSVSMDGVRQDFIIQRRPEGEGELRVELAVNGARAEPLVGGAQLVLDGSGRKIAYSRLRVTDATGKELSARLEAQDGARRSPRLDSAATTLSAADPPTLKRPEGRAPALLAVVVNDASAVYPVRIDPTFSDANWISMGGIPGASGLVYAAAVDGSGNLYLGGSFSIVGDVFATNIAKWDGTNWSALGSGMNGEVRALAVSGSDLYAGGAFTTAGGVAASRIAKWNGSSWSALGSGMNNTVHALAVSGSDLYAGGAFATAGGTAAANIAKWDGSSWSALASGMNNIVYALAVSGGDLYAGGQFTTAGGTAASRIAKWNGSSWSALGSGVVGNVTFPYYVYSLAVSGGDLYAGGSFTNAGGVTASRIAKWNGSSWSALGSGMVGPSLIHVYALTVSGSDLYAGGSFTNAGGVTVNRIAKWDGNSWSALGSGMDGDVRALAVSGTNLYAGGAFITAGGTGANYLAKWDGNSWSALGAGMNNFAFALAVSGSDLYAAGQFTTAGSTNANRVAKWDGSNWSALGSGMNNTVHALAVSGSDLYAGGAFTTADGAAANYIAKWNGSSWSPLASGMNNFAFALAVSGSDLYAGGAFTTAGGIAATNIAKWDGNSWSPLASGMSSTNNNGAVWALAVSGGDLYAGGQFMTAGGVTVNRIAKWNGSSWSALGSGMLGPFPTHVYALAVSGSDVYAGGSFTNAGGVTANRIAKWNGSSWSGLGSGMPGTAPIYVYALAVSGSDVYAGGTFTNASGLAVNRIAKWNGSTWSALGSGMNSEVRALAASGSDLYAAGQFTAAGSKVSAYIAKAYLVAPLGGVADSILASDGTANLKFYGNPGHSFDVQRTTNLTPPIIWTTLTTSPLSPADDGSFVFTDTNAPPGTAYYRAVER